MRRLLVLLGFVVLLAPSARAQDISVATVTRPPFSMIENGRETGFSLDLWAAMAKDLGLTYEIRRVEAFADMLNLVETRQADAAIANISITASREEVMDFSHPIFQAGLQIMVPSDKANSLALIKAIFSRDLLLAIAFAFALLFGGGLLMWRFERHAQPYFDTTAKEAMFPAFWWALNLVVNGGFEERVPRTVFGRIFGVFLVISSLFIVSVFVAKITAVMTVDALQNSVNTIHDLRGKQVGTIHGSTASLFLDDRDLRYTGFDDLDQMLAGFEAGDLDGIVFDAPILAFYATRSKGTAQMVGSVFVPENYGIALPSGSELSEPLNQSLLRLRENGTYGDLHRKWFGDGAGN